MSKRKIEGKIDKEGYLNLRRGNKMIMQYCPFQHLTLCGHQCPLFGEPERRILKEYMLWKLELCNKVLYFNKFVDERT